MSLKSKLQAWLGVPTESAVSELVWDALNSKAVESYIKKIVSNAIESPKIEDFYGLTDSTHKIHVYCKDEDVTDLFTQAEGVFQDGKFVFKLVLDTWVEEKSGAIHIVLPEVIQKKVAHGFNLFAVGNVMITTGSRSKRQLIIPAKAQLTKAFNGLYALKMIAPAYEHEPMMFPYGEYFDAKWKDVEVVSTRKDIPISWHYLQEGGTIYGSIDLVVV